MSQGYVAFVISPGYHQQTEHRFVFIDLPYEPNQSFDDLYPHLNIAKWTATHEFALAQASQLAREHEVPIKHYHFDEPIYQVRKRMHP